MNKSESPYIIELDWNVRVFAHKPNLQRKIDNPIPLKYGMWDANKGEYIAL